MPTPKFPITLPVEVAENVEEEILDKDVILEHTIKLPPIFPFPPTERSLLVINGLSAEY
jgi:hypothetical protein